MTSEKNDLATYTTRSAQTQKVIDKWRTSSPNVFNAANNLRSETGAVVNFMLGVSDETDAGNYGKNVIEYMTHQDGSGNITYSPHTAEFGENTVVAFVNPNTLISSLDPESSQFSLNHEAGHFLYWAANTTSYINYRNKLIANKTDLQGGHNPGNPSGFFAKAAGNSINPNVNALKIMISFITGVRIN